ncbi:MAG TPA: addiction module antidote protein [Ferrovaceae bacterium]|nr:addiction module antidote protein [Ferrovaceae bacterium]
MRYVIPQTLKISVSGIVEKVAIKIQKMTKTFGGVETVAGTAHLSTTQLYRTLSPEGNPVLSSLSAILKAMGLRLAVQSDQTPQAHA